MIAYLYTFICLLLELARRPLSYFVWIESQSACNSTDKDRDTATNTIPTLSYSNSSSSLSLDDSECEDLPVSTTSTSQTLLLEDFVNRSKDARDALALGQFLQTQSRWTSLHLEDTVDGRTYRRWLYKKTGIYRHILNTAANAKLSVTFSGTVEIDANQMPPKAITSLLREVQKDLDIQSLVIRGTLSPRQAEMVAMALVSLLSQDKRGWQTIHWQVQVTAEHAHQQREAQLVDRVCQRALQKVANQRYFLVKF
jgi:hypothetical protein